jgi:hypothetical protein
MGYDQMEYAKLNFDKLSVEPGASNIKIVEKAIKIHGNNRTPNIR